MGQGIEPSLGYLRSLVMTTYDRAGHYNLSSQRTSASQMVEVPRILLIGTAGVRPQIGIAHRVHQSKRSGYCTSKWWG